MRMTPATTPMAAATMNGAAQQQQQQQAAPPPSLASRHQRLLSGARVIKSYVHESEQRREASRFNNKAHLTADERRHALQDAKQEGAVRLPTKPSTAPANSSSNGRSNQHEELQAQYQQQQQQQLVRERSRADTQQPLAAFFAGKSVHRARRLSLSAAHAAQMHAIAASGGFGGATSPAKRKLQIETLATSSPPYRAPMSVGLASPRGRQNARALSSKLDSVLKSSQWMRRRVVLGDDSRQHGARGKLQLSPRRGSVVGTGASAVSDGGASAPTGASGTASGAGAAKELSHHDLEKKVMAAFSRIVRMWRDRKRRSEAQTLTMMNGNKLRKDNGIQSAHIVGILSRRMIREVPALTFFDVEPEPSANSAPGAAAGGGGGRGGGRPATVLPPTAAAVSRNTPRGVCYTLDANGCRSIKMESGALQSSRTDARDRRSRKSEEITIEKAMAKTLRRKMAKRVKTKSQEIRKLTDDFRKFRTSESTKLQSQLALHQAEVEKMFAKRLVLLMADDTSLPTYQAQKELVLSRVRCRKADLVEKCQTLRALGALLQHVEASGEASGLDVSAAELHFLDLFRCVIEEDKVLTPLISDGIERQLSTRDLQNATVHELLAILRSLDNLR